MDKVVKAIYELKNKMDADWSDRLKSLSIYEAVESLYDAYENYQANVLLAFVVFSCHQESEYLDSKKDRIEDKRRIMVTLAGPSALSDDAFRNAVYKAPEGALAQVMDWIFDYQMDWKIKARDSLDTFSSRALAAAAQVNPGDDPRSMKEKGLLATVAIEVRERADALHKQITETFALLDNIAVAEGRKAPTERPKSGGSWESYIQEKKTISGTTPSHD